MDGVLLDSEPLHHRAVNALLAEEAREPLSFEEFSQFLGVTAHDTWRDLIRRYHLPHPLQSYLERYDALILDSYRRYSEIAPGAQALLAKLEAHGVPLAVASSSRRAWVETCLETLAIRAYFTAIVSGDQVDHGKPDPEIYLLAARELGVPPEKCFAVEDAPKGIAAALAAGMLTVAVATPYVPRELTEGAHLHISSLSAFPELWSGCEVRAAEP